MFGVKDSVSNALQQQQQLRTSRVHEAARSEKLLGLLSDRAQTFHNDRTFYSK